VAQSFLELARELIDSPAAKADYAEDPDGFLTARGLEGLTAADLEVAVGFVADAVPVRVARQLTADAPGAAPDSAALARLAATTEVEAEVRQAEPGTVELAAVIDPAGELDLPEGVDLTTIAPAQEQEEQQEEEEAPAETTGAEAANAEQADASGVGVPEAEPSETVESDQPEVTNTDEADENGGEDDSPADDSFELDPELQPTVDPESTGDAGLPASGAATPAAEVEIPPEETFEDLI
jgi:hypothetical protein